MTDITVHFVDEERAPIELRGVKVMRFFNDPQEYIVIECVGEIPIGYERSVIDYMEI